MAEKRVIRIENILGGQSTYENFSGDGQFQTSLNIDPDLPAYEFSGSSLQSLKSSGFIRPSAGFVAGQFTGAPYWFKNSPKTFNQFFAYDNLGSVYTVSTVGVTGLLDLSSEGGSKGNGAEYYDNYIYFARNTTVARYGPLNGTPAITKDYWVSTLGKAELVNTTYPVHPRFGNTSGTGAIELPNHVMHRHSDGRLYFADVVGNQGVIHYISTTKTTVEGDTDNGSKFNAVDFPYGMWVTDMESYGTDLAVALFEGFSSAQSLNTSRAKIAFWNPSNETTYDKLIFVEFPDPCIFALYNSNGILYTFSGDLSDASLNAPGSTGVRVCRFVGGYTFEQVAYVDYALPPMPGAVEGFLNKVLFGSSTTEPVDTACVFGVGSKSSSVSNSIFNVFNVTSTTATINSYLGDDVNRRTLITALAKAAGKGINRYNAIMGWTRSAATEIPSYKNGMCTTNQEESTSFWPESIWRSQIFRIGEPFKITKIRIPLINTLDSGVNITPYIYVDNQRTTYELTTISSNNFSSTTRNVVIRPDGLTGQQNFFLSLEWLPSADLMTIGLPITIEYETIDD